MTFALTTAPLASVSEVLERDGAQALALQLLTFHPVEVAEALESLEHDDRYRVLRALPVNMAAQVLLNGDAEFRAGLSHRLSPENLAQILDRLPIEHAARLLEQLPEEHQASVLAHSAPDDAEQLQVIRQSAPGSVGRLMVRQIPRAQAEMTVAATFRYLRRSAARLSNTTNVYVLDPAGLLLGVVALRELVEADPLTRLGDLMQTRVVMVTPDTDQEEAANLVSRYNFSALPVVDEERRLLGIVTVDDLVDVLIREGTEDALAMGAVSSGRDEEQVTDYWAGRLSSVIRKRFGWLFLLFIAGALTSLVLGFFEGDVRNLVTLALFVPLLIGTGGNAGSQTVITVVRGLAVGEIRLRDSGRVIAREVLTGAVLGVLLGILAFGGVSLALGDVLLGTAVAGSLVAVCAWSNLLGAGIPLAARAFRLDSAIVSTPFITTIVDATGLAIYFLIARVILGLPS